MKWFLYVLVLLLPMNSLASDFDETDEMSITNAKKFVKNFPIVGNELDEIGLVELWSRIQGLQNLVSVWDSNPAAFEREGPDELQLWQIRKRIWSHKTYGKYTGNDELVKALVAIIRLHATMADRYMNDEISYSPYADVAAYAVLSGRYFAKRIWIKYGKCIRGPKAEGKIIM
jgi:hypothetical protein